MREEKLNEKQIEAAKNAALEACGLDLGDVVINAIAPYVQMRGEAEPPTKEECFRAYKMWLTMNGYAREGLRDVLSVYSNGRADEIKALKEEIERLKAKRGFTVEQVREAAMMAFGSDSEDCECADRIVKYLASGPTTPEEQYKVVHHNGAWAVMNKISGNTVGEPDGFLTRANAEIFREGLIARAKKEAE